MIYKIVSGVKECYCDSFITGPSNEPLMVSFYDRSSQLVRSIGAGIILDKKFSFDNRNYTLSDQFEVFYTQIVRGKEKFTHGVAFSTALRENYLVTTPDTMQEDLYYHLMNQYSLPLLREWMAEIQKAMTNRGYLYRGYKGAVYGADHEVLCRGRSVRFSELHIYSVTMDEEKLRAMVSRLLQDRKIWITEEEQKPLKIENMDDYFARYGSSIIKNLENQLHPVTGLDGEINRIALKRTRPYPQQAAMINGVYEYFRHKKRGSVLFVMGTGTGKTLQSSSAAEMLYVGKWLEQNPGKTLADAYAHDGIINYRHIVMCPGHLVEKWKESIEEEIPYAKAVIIKTFQQLIDIRNAGRERKNGKEFYIMSKDFCKLSYQRVPSPKKMGTRCIDFFHCKDCNAAYASQEDGCPLCGSHNIEILHSRYKRTGMICPHCNRLLYRKGIKMPIGELYDEDNKDTLPLTSFDFASETTSNEVCFYCGEKLWVPYVKNINTEFGYTPKEIPWVRQTFWANKSKKGKKTYWILRGTETEARFFYGEVLNEIDRDGGCRKYSPAEYIKKYLKGYFDVFIADEVHKSKGGATAQGNAFHWVMKSCRYTFGLSGSISGGVASDLFYLLFRMNPKRMKEHGYEFGSVLKFAQDYGCVEQDFEVITDVRYASLSRGKQLSQPRVRPGISPEVFSEFLLDSAVFLNISDMSANMPPLYERIKLVTPKEPKEIEEQRVYRRILDDLRYYEREAKVNLTSERNQFAMSYLDKPYGVPPFVDPRNGDEIAMVPDYSELVKKGGMLEKERCLVELVGKELSENRNCVIYAEYTASDTTNVLPRLKSLLMKQLGLGEEEVVTLRSSSPSAEKRERWMHDRAARGMKVMICNPRLCETGLDFCWKEKGNIYNYPTLIFYQCGYSLFTEWQAAGRSWRLNQREECRTYYLAYSGTVQQAILQVLGEKKAAASAIQGKFSADGLASMAKGVDTQLRIAQIMKEMDDDSGNRLQEMFDVISDKKDDSEYGSCQKMKLLNEIINMVDEKPELVNQHQDLFKSLMSFDFFGAMDNKKAETALNINALFSRMILSNQASAVSPLPPKKKRRRKSDSGNYSLFDDID